MGCITTTAHRVRTWMRAVAEWFGVGISVSAARVGNGLCVDAYRMDDGICPVAHRIGKGLSAGVSLVCTLTQDTGVEVWWTNDWKVLFSNGQVVKWED